MARKFIAWRQDPSRPLDLANKKKWRQEGRSYKLVAPDVENDRQFTYGEVKAIKEYKEDDRLYIAGIANANIVDRVGDRVEPRGLKLEDYLKNPQLLAHHSYYHPVGRVEELDIQDDGIHFRGWIGDPAKAELTEMQKEIRSLVAQGILNTVSIGFIPLKVRPPLFDEDGNLEEPFVIEEWEMLELSIVAVPCNQDALFEVRGYQSSAKTDKVKPETPAPFNVETFHRGLEDLAQKNKLVECLVFSKDRFNADHVKRLADGLDFGLSHVFREDVDGKGFGLVLKYGPGFERDEEIELCEGVFAMTVKPKASSKKGTKESEGEDNSEENYQKETIQLLRQMNEGIKKSIEMTQTVLDKIMEDPDGEAEYEEEEEEDKAGKEEEEEEDEDMKNMSDRLKALEDNFAKVVDTLAIIAEKVGVGEVKEEPSKEANDEI